uniref:Uncharacterized protein n=1 Tax=Anguilla anguilla TaxID=7936 RepID=A0A0E9VHK7_ANGAN
MSNDIILSIVRQDVSNRCVSQQSHD